MRLTPSALTHVYQTRAPDFLSTTDNKTLPYIENRNIDTPSLDITYKQSPSRQQELVKEERATTGEIIEQWVSSVTRFSSQYDYRKRYRPTDTFPRQSMEKVIPVPDPQLVVENLQEIAEDLTLLLEIKLPKLSQMAAATTNETYEENIGHTVSTLEFRLSDLKQMLLEYKESALLGIVVQFVIEATVNKFMSSIQTAYKQVVSSEDILASTSEELSARMDWSRVRNTNAKFVIVKKLKMAPKILKQMGKKFGESLRSFGRNIKKWTAIKTWKGFKGKLKSTFKSPLQKLKKCESIVLSFKEQAVCEELPTQLVTERKEGYRYDLIEYEYFPIDTFRPRCDVNATTFQAKMYTQRKSKLMRDVIVHYVNGSNTESLSMLVDAIHNAYSGVADKHIASFGKSITD
ncbi:unnamed protein product [Mytilus coruscus]|uniref:Uncharacterized protein n=1 Tax=Mytilus coruscus TaxID=42192 RepID=A0A6J8CJW1_MYTCO|nr:unnamed protein product [Mytilus coruscus]